MYADPLSPGFEEAYQPATVVDKRNYAQSEYISACFKFPDGFSYQTARGIAVDRTGDFLILRLRCYDRFDAVFQQVPFAPLPFSEKFFSQSTGGHSAYTGPGFADYRERRNSGYSGCAASLCIQSAAYPQSFDEMGI